MARAGAGVRGERADGEGKGGAVVDGRARGHEAGEAMGVSGSRRVCVDVAGFMCHSEYYRVGKCARANYEQATYMYNNTTQPKSSLPSIGNIKLGPIISTHMGAIQPLNV